VAEFGLASRIKVLSIKATARCLISEKPDLMPTLGFFLSKGVIGDKSATSFPVWNNGATYDISDVFFHHVFDTMPQASPREFYKDLNVEFFGPIVGSLVLENNDPVNTYGNVVRVHVDLEYEIIRD